MAARRSPTASLRDRPLFIECDKMSDIRCYYGLRIESIGPHGLLLPRGDLFFSSAALLGFVVVVVVVVVVDYVIYLPLYNPTI